MVDKKKNEVLFIYDGECPLCLMGATYFRIRDAIGDLKVINAREENSHTVLDEINSRNINLDEGMVIKYQENFYHGEDALHMMAILGSNFGLFNRVNAILFRSKKLSRILYPSMRGTRNLMLKIKKVDQLKNLEKNDEKMV